MEKLGRWSPSRPLMPAAPTSRAFHAAHGAVAGDARIIDQHIDRTKFRRNLCGACDVL